MKKVLFIILSLTFINLSQAQESDTTKIWTKGGQIGINASEVGFYNWSKGGDNSMSGTSFFSVFANRTNNGWVWENKLDLEYGMKQDQSDILKKTDDRIELNTKIGKKTKDAWYYTGYLNFKSQFSQGFNYDESSTLSISDFLSPGYLIVGLGMDYKPNEYFSALASPIASKTTFVLNQRHADSGSYGVTPAEYNEFGIKIKNGETIRSEVGANLVLTFKKDIFKNVNFSTKLDLFSNYLEKPQNIDVDWQSTITMKVNDFLNVVFKTHLIYDDDTNVEWEKDGEMHNSPITQFKQSLAVGLMYKF